MNERENLQKAIDTIKEYCSCHECGHCIFGNKSEECLLANEQPYFWPDADVMEDMYE